MCGLVTAEKKAASGLEGGPPSLSTRLALSQSANLVLTAQHKGRGAGSPLEGSWTGLPRQFPTPTVSHNPSSLTPVASCTDTDIDLFFWSELLVSCVCVCVCVCVCDQNQTEKEKIKTQHNSALQINGQTRGRVAVSRRLS